MLRAACFSADSILFSLDVVVEIFVTRGGGVSSSWLSSGWCVLQRSADLLLRAALGPALGSVQCVDGGGAADRGQDGQVLPTRH